MAKKSSTPNKIERSARYDFPDQRVPENKKTTRFKEDSLNFVIEYCTNNDMARSEIKARENAIIGELDSQDYNYVLNPYNSKLEELRNFPAKLRNYDITTDIYRRYLGEYLSRPHEFVVKTNDSDYTNRMQRSIDSEIDMELDKRLNNEIINQFELNPELKAPISGDLGEFVDYKKTNYEDTLAINGQVYLNFIIDQTKSKEIYLNCYSDYITTGRCVTYRCIDHNDIDKERVDPMEYFRPPSKNDFIEDDNMGTRLQYMTIEEIDAKFGKRLSKKDRDYIMTCASNSNGQSEVLVPIGILKSKYDGRTYHSFYDDPSKSRDTDYVKFSNSNLHYPVYHAFWITEKEISILTYVDDFGITQTTTVEHDYKLDLEIGDISIEKDYILSYMQGWRIGEKDAGVYLDMDYIQVQRSDMNDYSEVKAPYNGVTSLVGNYEFSLGKILAPHKALYNVMKYHQERIIARNDGNILVLPEGLIASTETYSDEERLYYAKADGKLYIDDTNPAISTLVQAIKVVELGDYNLIKGLGELLLQIKDEARESVDMNRQRYGDIMSSSGKATTEQAIIKSSIGTYPIVTKFEWFIERDYNSDLDHSKIAWREGKKGSYVNSDLATVSFEVNPTEHIGTSYDVHVRSAIDQEQKIKAYRDLAFSAAQGGEFGMAGKAIEYSNTAQLSRLISSYQDKIDAQKASQQQSAEKIAQAAEQFKLQSEDKNLQMEKYGYDTDYAKTIHAKLLDIQGKQAKGEDVTTDLYDIGQELDKKLLEREKLNYQKGRDIQKDQLEREKLATQMKIAKTNKN